MLLVEFGFAYIHGFLTFWYDSPCLLEEIGGILNEIADKEVCMTSILFECKYKTLLPDLVLLRQKWRFFTRLGAFYLGKERRKRSQPRGPSALYFESYRGHMIWFLFFIVQTS
jgi:hypothetical protein